MPYRLRFIDPADRAALDVQELEHCEDEATALRWLAAQRCELPIQLIDAHGAVIGEAPGIARPGGAA